MFEAAVTVRLVAFVSMSFTVNGVAGIEVSSGIVRSEIAEIVGASLTGVTVTLNHSVDEALPSLTVREMVTGPPFALEAGETVTVRLAPVPDTRMFESG